MDPKLIRQKLGLAPEATDEEVLAKLDAVTAAATDTANAKTAQETAEREKTEIENSVTGKDREITSLREAHNNSILDAAVETGRITQAERATWATRLAGANRATEINSIQALTPKLNGKGITLDGRRDERQKADDVREQVANAIAKEQRDNGLSYHQAHVKVKKDPQFKEYFNRTEG